MKSLEKCLDYFLYLTGIRGAMYLTISFLCQFTRHSPFSSITAFQDTLYYFGSVFFFLMYMAEFGIRLLEEYGDDLYLVRGLEEKPE